MRKQSSRSAYINFRVLIACTLCLAGLSLAVAGLGAWPVPAVVRYAAQLQAAREAKLAMKKRLLGEASKTPVIARPSGVNTSSGGGAAMSNPSQAQPAIGAQSRVAMHSNTLGQTVYSISPSRFDVSPPLSELAKIPVPERPQPPRRELELPPERTLRANQPDPVAQVAPRSKDSANGPSAPTTAATGFNFDGVPGGALLAGYPPDPNGSVGNNQFVEMVNVRYQVWSLNRTTHTPTSLVGPVDINTLWAGFGGACQTQNAGDPVVIYDKVANRWLLSQFTSSPDGSGNFFQCVAISKTPDATKEYFRYAFAVPGKDFGDYPHYGVWSDAYYVMEHNFTPDANCTGGFCFHAGAFGAMDRTKMLAGDPSATWQVILDPQEGGHMPADLDGFAPPPGGAPGIFTSVHPDGMYLYRMKVDFANAANTTRTLQAKMPIAPASAACGGGNCIPQPNNPTTLASLADRLMFRLAYRNFIDHESLVISHAVDPGVPGVVSGVRWYEFRISGQPDNVCSTYPCTYQQGTVADEPNGRSRWASSISQDGFQNMLVGYSTTGTLEPTDAHSIRYTGRAKNHPLGTMTVPEAIIFTGNRNEVADNTLGTLPGRWGDYTSMSIDPADDCTFWYVNEYYKQGQQTNTNFDWNTRIASAAFAPPQCQPSTCTSRPTSAPTIGTASVIGTNQIRVTWSAIAPAPGSYAIERALKSGGQVGLYQPLVSVPGSATSFTDTTVQGGLSYSYRVIAATDAAGKCQALVRSGAASATASGNCTLKPVFAGAISATSVDGPICGITVNWSPGTVSCPLRQIRYNVYRGTEPDFVPAANNRVASCISGPSSYTDTSALDSGSTYYYVVRAEDNSTGNGGACGGNEEANTVRVPGTAFGPGKQATPGTWTDGGGDITSFLRLNTSGGDPAWRIVRTADDPGANHTPGGAYAYRNTGPGPDVIYGDLQCSAAETPALTVGATSVNLTYWERHQFEMGWDGVAIEYSRNGGPWTDVPAPSNSTADGCMASDVTADYGTLECTEDPPINACAFPSTKPVITGPNLLPAGNCTTYMTGNLTDYGRRCHHLTGLKAGDKIQFRWKFSSDPATAYKGFYLDDIAVSNITLPTYCVPGAPATPTPTPTPSPGGSSTPTPTPGGSSTPTPTPGGSSTPTPIPTATVSPTPSPSPSATVTPTPTATASPTPSATATPVVAQLLNISTRARVQTGNNIMIGGFIVTGSGSKNVLIRALGPSLNVNGTPVSGRMADPVLELYDKNGARITTNDNWKDKQQTQIEATRLQPPDAHESAILRQLTPGQYTAVLRGKNDGTGIALVEVYDLDKTPGIRLANISTRGFVETNDNVMIGGFIAGPRNRSNAAVVVRALGPSLTAKGVPNALQDPVLELHDKNGAVVASNDNWESDKNAAKVLAAGLAPTDPRESALYSVIGLTEYTAVVRDKDNTTGNALVEVYNLH